MKSPPWSKSSLKLETAEGQLWRRAFSDLKPQFQKKLSKHNLIPTNVELLELKPLFQEDIPRVGGYYSIASMVVFLPLNTQEFILEKLLGGAGGQSGFQGTGLLGKKSIENFLSDITSRPCIGAQSFKEFELSLKTSRYLSMEFNIQFDKYYQASLWIPWDQRKKFLESIGVQE